MSLAHLHHEVEIPDANSKVSSRHRSDCSWSLALGLEEGPRRETNIVREMNDDGYFISESENPRWNCNFYVEEESR